MVTTWAVAQVAASSPAMAHSTTLCRAWSILQCFCAENAGGVAIETKDDFMGGTPMPAYSIALTVDLSKHKDQI
jgi:hypothetical protein